MIIRKSIWDENNLKERTWTPWWAAFRTSLDSDNKRFGSLRDRVLSEHNLKFYYGDNCDVIIENFAIEGDEKDIFEFIMRWS